MTQEELSHFLASVRRTRFIDYLDPMGETAHQALERRMKWAARSQSDPAHADEALFLLRDEQALRGLVTEELLDGDDDWVESAAVGSEWGADTWQSAARSPSHAPLATPPPAEPEPEPEPG